MNKKIALTVGVTVAATTLIATAFALRPNPGKDEYSKAMTRLIGTWQGGLSAPNMQGANSLPGKLVIFPRADEFRIKGDFAGSDTKSNVSFIKSVSFKEGKILVDNDVALCAQTSSFAAGLVNTMEWRSTRMGECFIARIDLKGNELKVTTSHGPSFAKQEIEGTITLNKVQ
jgi:hypothetical protein